MSSNQAYSKIGLTTFDEDKVRAAVVECRERIGGPPSIVFAFITSDWRPHLDDFLELVQVHGHAPVVAGCSADGLIGTGQEDEGVSGFSLLFLRLPEARISRCAISVEDMESAKGANYWNTVTGIASKDGGAWVILANPVLMNAETWLKGWTVAYPGIQCFGGLASGGSREDDLFLFGCGSAQDTAALAIHFGGGIRLAGVLSQGCRPIGEPYTITSVEENLVVEIASKSAFEMLEQTFHGLEEGEQAMARGNIFAGLAMSEYVEDYGRGDFLVRNIIGGDPDAGVLALGAFPRVGQTLQFQLRDKDAADEDLRKLCLESHGRFRDPFATLLFTCTGRGSRMFGIPNHDAGVIEEAYGRLPGCGFFCNGEIGPVGEQSFVHGYTASLVLFLDE